MHLYRQDNHRKEPHIGRHSQRLQDRGHRVKWFDLDGTLESALVPLEGLESPRLLSTIQGNDINDLGSVEITQVKSVNCGLYSPNQTIKHHIVADGSLDHQCSHDPVDRTIGLSVTKEKLRSCSLRINDIHDESEFEFLAKSKVPRKLRSDLLRKCADHGRLGNSRRTAAESILQPGKAIVVPRDCSCAGEVLIACDAALKFSQLRLLVGGKAMEYCHDELDDILNEALARATSVNKSMGFAQRSSVLPYNGCNFPKNQLQSLKHLKMPSGTMLHPGGSSLPAPELRLSSSSANENANLVRDFYMKKGDNFPRNHSSITNSPTHFSQAACENRGVQTCRESQLYENYSQSIPDFTDWLSSAAIDCSNNEASKERFSSLWDMCNLELAADLRISPQAIDANSNCFDQIAGPPLSSAACQITGESAHIQLNQRIDEISGAFLNQEPLDYQLPSDLGSLSSRSCFMRYQSEHLAQDERISAMSEQLRSHLHAHSPAQNMTWKEPPSQRLASQQPTFPIGLYGSARIQVSEGIPILGSYSTHTHQTLCETLIGLAGSAPVDLPTKSLKSNAQGRRGHHFDLNEIPTSGLKSKPKKHRPKVARDKLPRTKKTPKKSKAKETEFPPMPHNLEGAGVCGSYETPSMNFLQRLGPIYAPPRDRHSSTAPSNSLVEQVASLHCPMMPRRTQTAHQNKVQRTDGYLEPEGGFLLFKETSSHESSSQVTSADQHVHNYLKTSPGDLNVKNSRKKRGIDNGKLRVLSKSKTKAQAITTVDSNIKEASWPNHSSNCEMVLSTNVLNYSQEGQFVDQCTAKDYAKQAYKRNSKIRQTGSKRKLVDVAQLNAGYDKANAQIDSRIGINTLRTSNSNCLSSSMQSLQAPHNGNSCSESGQKGMSMPLVSSTNEKLAKNSQEIEIWLPCHPQGNLAVKEICTPAALTSSWMTNDFIDNLTHCFQLLNLDEAPRPLKNLEIVPYSNPDTTLVPYEGPFNPVRRKKPRPKVLLDVESNRMWNLLMGKDSEKQHCVESQDEIDKKWVERRAAMKAKVDLFISRMHDVQGDRRFSLWKGSVVDSVVGAFLTQNVSDHLSSSAFMALAAKFPINREAPALNGTKVNLCQNCEQHDAAFYGCCEKSLCGECGNEDTDEFALSCPIENAANRDCFSPAYESDDTKSPSKDRDYRVTPGSSESVVRGLSPSDKNCNGESPTYPTPLSSIEAYSSAKYANSKQKDNLFYCEREDILCRSLEESIKSSPYIFKKERICGPVRRQLFKEFTSTSQAIEDNSSCITDSSIQDLGVAERLLPEKVVAGKQFDGTNCSRNFCQLENCSSTVGIASQKGYSHDVHNTEITAVSCRSENQFTVDELFNGDLTGYAGSCTTFHRQNHEHNDVNDNVETENPYPKDSTCDGNLSNADALLVTSDGMPLAFQHVPCYQSLTTFEAEGAVNYKPLEENSKSIITNENDAFAQVAEKIPSKLSGIERAKREQSQGGSKKNFDWESLRQKLECVKRQGDDNIQDSPESSTSAQDGIDWEAVRLADVKDVADVIKERGMNNILAGRIKAFLARLYSDHGSINLEWLRKIPVDDAKNFLLSIRGLGLKSVECIRLLTLQHLAFPVDTNVGRICVRLGWVPIEPLPEELQLHLLELYPVQATIQKYLWPRLCTLDQRTLYELHYQMITFGKVFCTKSRPNCNACPMKGDCKHFSSAFASAKLALPAPEQKDWKDTATLALPPPEEIRVRQNKSMLALLPPEDSTPSEQLHALKEQVLRAVANLRKQCEPIIEEPASPEPLDLESLSLLIEQPSSPSLDDNYIVISDQSGLHLTTGTEGNNLDLQQVGSAISKALILMPPDSATIPVPKLKNVGRLRTVHYVYELPDDHELLAHMDAREADDPCFYLFAIWSPGECLESPPGLDHNREVNHAGYDSVIVSEETVKGTLLVPCRTAMRGSFPLNGTYFQVNEVFADHESSLNPIEVQRSSLWSLQRRFVYFGTSVPSIFRGLTRDEIKACFWQGYVCVRGFERHQRAPKPLAARLHFPASKRVINKKKIPSDGEVRPL